MNGLCRVEPRDVHAEEPRCKSAGTSSSEMRQLAVGAALASAIPDKVQRAYPPTSSSISVKLLQSRGRFADGGVTANLNDGQ
jgi:hypothetical protein